jgi:hypothetical protein
VTTPTQPYPVARRIPADQPYVVHISIKKWGLRAGLGGGMLVLIFLCLAGLAAADAGWGAALALAGFALAVAGLIGLQVWRLVSGGPVLAAGPAGLWIRTRMGRGQAIWLPWEAIALISRRRWMFDKMLVVQPHDPRVTKGLGARTAFSSLNSSAVYGDGFLASLTMADRKEAEILQAVAHFAANRVHLA